MIPELGHFALILAFCLALVQSIFPLIGAARQNPTWMAMARPLAYGQTAFLSFSFACLIYAFISNDFSVSYVAANSNTHLPLGYRIAAVWGAHEGSLLLWVMILGLWMSAVAWFSKSLPEEMLARVLAILAIISAGFLLFVLMTSDPFARLLPETPIEGRDLNPLLQDPGLAIHPPMLYMGYVGFSVAFAFAIAGLLNGRLDAAWARWTRPWTLVAWCFLTYGITLGSWWSYRVLGWGGWWFWDPVENASFLPWLTGTALIHSLATVEKRNTFKSWTVLMAICAFSLSLLGTFLVRSGVLVSVHAFAVDPARGAFMLKFLLLVIGGSLLLYAWRGPKIRGIGHFELLSRETLLLSNNVLLMVAAATVLLGTLYPLILQTLTNEKLSVGPPYFNAVFIPLVAPFLFFMGIGPLCRWKHMPVNLLLQRIRYSLPLSLSLGIILPWAVSGREPAMVVLGLTLAFWVIIATLQELWGQPAAGQSLINKLQKLPLSHYGRAIAHIGVAVCVMGITLVSNYSAERELRLVPGEVVDVGNYAFKFVGVEPLTGPNYTGVVGKFAVAQSNQTIGILNAEKRLYTASQTSISQAAIKPGLFRDLYVTLGAPTDNQGWAVRIYYKPFVRWIWLGGLLIVLGGLLAALDKRYRV
ncbi:heme lyase CcmF/NrfE family subunit [soil metagenome]